MIPLSCPAVGDDRGDEGMRSRSEQAIGDLAQALLENPVLNQAISAAFGARDKALEAQQAAMGALNLPSASEVERLERRLRSLSERLEAVEEQVDRVGRDVAAIRRQLAGDVDVAADQARLRVEET
jgi:chromosome segregation ATPase